MLPRTKTFEGRARRWMVSNPWLESNKAEDDQLYLLDNGKAWGEAADPQEIMEIIDATKKAKSEALKAKKAAKRKSDTIEDSVKTASTPKPKRRKAVPKAKTPFATPAPVIQPVVPSTSALFASTSATPLASTSTAPFASNSVAVVPAAPVASTSSAPAPSSDGSVSNPENAMDWMS